MKRSITVFATFFAGLYFVLEFLLPSSFLDAHNLTELHEPISYGFIAIGSMAFGLGLINLIRVHGSMVAFNKKGAFYSGVLLFGLFSMLTIAVFDWTSTLTITKNSERIERLGAFATRIVTDAHQNTPDVLPAEKRQILLIKEWSLVKTELGLAETIPHAMKTLDEKLSSIDQIKFLPDPLMALVPEFNQVATQYRSSALKSHESSWVKFSYDLLNNGVFIPLGAAMFSLLGFYIAAAAFRAFRVKSFEAFLMMMAAVLVICGQTSFTLSWWSGFSGIRDWLLQVPNAAAFRAITIGAGIAGLILSLRMWFSVESGSFARREKEK